MRRLSMISMASLAWPISFFFSALIIISPAVTATTPTAIKITLSPFQANHPAGTTDAYQILNNLATSSISRAHHLKHSHPKTTANSSSSSSSSSPSLLKSRLFPHSYGGYTISLSFGNPAQSLTFIMDTGSSLTWFPCTTRYLCSQCTFPNVDPTKIPTYFPKLSSTKKLLGCQNPKCRWLFGPNVQSRCRGCDAGTKNCTQTCPPYIIQYGLGSTGGLLLLEDLVFPKQTSFPNFLVGCSVFSTRQPAGIAGFGRSSESLPSQLGLKKFSYCLVSRRFDDTGISSNMVLETGPGSGSKTPGLSYTPFYNNRVGSNPVFQEFYYVTLRKIMVGHKHVKVPYRYMVPGSDGNGGTIVDSGSTFTFMERPVFERVANEFEKQMGNYSRAKGVEAKSGLAPCFNISGQKSVPIPELTLVFKGGAKMALPLANYFSFVGGPQLDVVCLMVVTNNIVGQGFAGGGPAIIIGNFQQQNYYIEYDLANERFGFAKKSCV